MQTFRNRLAQIVATDTWIKPYLTRYKKIAVLVLVVGVLASLFAAGLMFVAGYLISASASLPESIMLLNLPLIFVRVFGVGKPPLKYIERLLSHDWVLRMTSDLRQDLYRSFDAMGRVKRAGLRMGDMLGLISDDIAHIQNLYIKTVFPSLIAYAVYIVILIVLHKLSWFLVLGSAVVLGVIVILFPLISVLKNGAIVMQRQELTQELYRALSDNILGVQDWIYAQRGDEFVMRHEAIEREIERLKIREERYADLLSLAGNVLFGVLVIGIIGCAACKLGFVDPQASDSMFEGLRSAYSGDVSTFGTSRSIHDSVNWIAAWVLGVFPLIEVFSQVTPAWLGGADHITSVERLNNLPQHQASNETGRATMQGVSSQEGSATLELTPGLQISSGPDLALPSPVRPTPYLSSVEPPLIELMDVHFTYPGSRTPVLNGVSCSFAPRSVTALLGRSGSGKSTLVSLIIQELNPTSGTITCSEKQSLSKLCSVIPQHPYIFNMTFRENLTIGSTGASDDEIKAILAKVGLTHLLERLPEGLDTIVDEAGLRFSGGERQRVALARVLFQDRPVVILDEPTVGLDPVTEKALYESLFKALAEKTVILITHNLAGVHLCDQAIFLDKGRVEMSGSPSDLAVTHERFRKLLDLEAYNSDLV